MRVRERDSDYSHRRIDLLGFGRRGSSHRKCVYSDASLPFRSAISLIVIPRSDTLTYG